MSGAVNTVAYCRVSTKKEDQMHSLEAQRGFFEQFIKGNDEYNFIRIYADEGITGTKLKNRKELFKLREDAKKKQFDLVLVKDVTRWARNTVDFLETLRELKKHKIRVFFVQYNLEYEEMNEFHITLLAALAQEESNVLSKRVKFGKKINAQKGRVPNLVYGYDKIPEEYFDLDINEREANVVRRIFQMYTVDGYGANKIAQILNKEGLRTKRNCNWSQNAIVRILNNPLYVGKIINGKQEVISFLEGTREDKGEDDWLIMEKPGLQIIENDVFEKAQNILQDRYNVFKITGERNSSKHLFSKLIKCAHCGYSFRREKREFKNTYVRWTCSHRNAHGADTCPNKIRVDESELIESLNNFFRDVLKSSDYLSNIVDEFKKIHEANDENLLNEKELQDRLKGLEQDKEKELDLYRENLVTKEYMLNKVKPINEAIEQVNKRLEMLREKISMSEKLEDILQKTFNSLEDMVNVSNLTNQMLKEIVSSIEVDKDGNTVINLRLMEELGLSEGLHIPFDDGGNKKDSAVHFCDNLA